MSGWRGGQCGGTPVGRCDIVVARAGFFLQSSGHMQYNRLPSFTMLLSTRMACRHTTDCMVSTSTIPSFTFLDACAIIYSQTEIVKANCLQQHYQQSIWAPIKTGMDTMYMYLTCSVPQQHTMLYSMSTDFILVNKRTECISTHLLTRISNQLGVLVVNTQSNLLMIMPTNQFSKMQTRMLKETNQSTILDMVIQIHGTSSIAKIQSACIPVVTMVRALTRKSIHAFVHAHVEFPEASESKRQAPKRPEAESKQR